MMKSPTYINRATGQEESYDIGYTYGILLVLDLHRSEEARLWGKVYFLIHVLACLLGFLDEFA